MACPLRRLRARLAGDEAGAIVIHAIGVVLLCLAAVATLFVILTGQAPWNWLDDKS